MIAFANCNATQKPMNRFAAKVLFSFLLVAAAPVYANTSQAVGVMQKWKSSDRCARQAQTAFPDFTPEANAKREASLRAWLEGGGLPPRDRVTPGH